MGLIPEGTPNPVAEAAKTQVIGFNQLEETLAVKLNDYPESRKFSPFVEVLHSNDEVILIAYGNLLKHLGVKALGEGTIKFSHTFFRPRQNRLEGGHHGYATTYTPNRLEIGLHTDPATESLVKKFYNPDQDYLDSLGTYFYVDKEGRYDKFVLLPKDIPDHRSNLSGSSYSSRLVLAEMRIEDFGLVGLTLEALIDTVNTLPTS